MTSSLTEYRPRQRPIASGRALPSPLPEFVKGYIQAGNTAVAEPFRGLSTEGSIIAGLFPIGKTGVSAMPIADAAAAWLAALGPEQRAQGIFPLDSEAWRRWSNIHVFTLRHGVCLDELSPTQRDRALALLGAALSPQGLASARNIMKLNESIAEITGRFEEYGEWLYWLSVMGTPSATEPWGWQIDGHHLIVNCFVLGDQIVMTPLFMGSEPVAVASGKYAGTRVFDAEEQNGLALMHALTAEQRTRAVLGNDLPGELFTTAFRDNLELHYAGVRGADLSSGQQELLMRLIETYVGRIRPGHAAVKLAEVRAHLADTHVAWMGGFEADSVFYYRIHSPVILIEFDHQRGIALDNDVPSRNHIHTVVRTPNGNDYGKDLLRQHYE